MRRSPADTISVLKHLFKTEDAYRVRKSAHVRMMVFKKFFLKWHPQGCHFFWPFHRVKHNIQGQKEIQTLYIEKQKDDSWHPHGWLNTDAETRILPFSGERLFPGALAPTGDGE